MTLITPVILCGGSGTRLWPLSRKSHPKQFVPLIQGKSLLGLTLERLQCFSDPILVAQQDYRFMVMDELRILGLNGTVLLEPVGRNTAPAMAMAALLALENKQEILLFCPADHYIPNHELFQKTILQGLELAKQGYWVTFGVVPTHPSTAYGYIKCGGDLDGAGSQVLSFVEKPTLEQAQQLLLTGNYLWNAGIFMCSPSVLWSSLERFAPDIAEICLTCWQQKKFELVDQFSLMDWPLECFSACRSESIDYAVLERHDKIAVVPFAGQWSDVGSWNEVARFTAADELGNRIKGQGVALKSQNTYIQASDRLVVTLGVTDLLVIDTPDALLITHADCVQQVKEVVAHLFQCGYKQVPPHRLVGRPWGWYDSIVRGERFQVKHIGVKLGGQLSLQKHHHRAEHWVVVKGTAEVTRGSETFILSENQSTYIPVGVVHRLKNVGKVELEMIEVQSGSYLGEDDIIRLEDQYGRSQNV